MFTEKVVGKITPWTYGFQVRPLTDDERNACEIDKTKFDGLDILEITSTGRNEAIMEACKKFVGAEKFGSLFWGGVHSRGDGSGYTFRVRGPKQADGNSEFIAELVLQTVYQGPEGQEPVWKRR
jgi:hypothetical protein